MAGADAEYDLFADDAGCGGDDGWELSSVGATPLWVQPRQCCVWESARLLSAWLLAHPAAVRGRTVVELGCGAALPSFAACAAGARRVTATDVSATAVGIVAAARDRSAPGFPQLRAAVVDWREIDRGAAEGEGPADVVLAADVNYESALVGPLVAAVAAHLPPHGLLLLATREGRVSLGDAHERLAAAGLRADATEQLAAGADGGAAHTLYHYRWADAPPRRG